MKKCVALVLALSACGQRPAQSNNASTQADGGSSGVAEQSENNHACNEYDGVTDEVASGQLYAYFSMYNSVDSSVFSELKRNGGLSVVGFPRVGGKCNVAFKARGIVKGDSYDIDITCPVLGSVNSDSDSSKKSVSKIDVENCRT